MKGGSYMHKAYLLLEDSSIFEGFYFGYDGEIGGEVVFTTGMAGYPEALTDPSYAGQIVTFTYPLQGNYGVPKKIFHHNVLTNFESDKIRVQAMIVSSYVDTYSHWSARQSLGNWLKTEHIPGIYSIDTRRLTKKLREKGVMLGKISKTKQFPKSWHDPNKDNLVAKVSVKKPVVYGKGSRTIIVVDCGVKHSILSELLQLGAQILRVPWNYDLKKHKGRFDAVVISNGPGDPVKADKTQELMTYCLSQDIPLLGICLGNQILALAAGGNTYKLPYGHRSHNQPSFDQFTKRSYMTTQNHGFCPDVSSLSSEWEEWFINLNDQTNEGIRHKKKPFWSVQFHPEGKPGPNDTLWIFRDFLKMVDKR